MVLLERAPVASSNLGPIVNIVCWLLIACVILAVAVKLLLGSVAAKRSHFEDAAIVCAMVFSIAYSAVLSVAGSNGVGQPRANLSPDQLDRLQKTLFAADFFLLPTLAASQLSLLILIDQITPVRTDKIIVKIIGTFVLLWCFVSIWVVGFQCAGPERWRLIQNQCINQKAFWTVYGIVNIVVEVIITIIPTYIVLRANFDRTRKITLLSCFLSRLCLLVTWIAALVMLQPLQVESNFTHDSWRYFLCIELTQSLAVITQCIPYIRNLLLGADSGMIRTGHFRLRANSKAAPVEGSGGSGSRSRSGTNGLAPQNSSGSWGLELHATRKSPIRSQDEV